MKPHILLIATFFCNSILLSQTLTQTRTSGRIFTNWPARWTNLSPASIAADDNKYLSTIKLSSGNSRPIVFTGLDFSIPSSATIERIGIRIIRLKSGKNNVKDGFCTLVTGPDDQNACGAFPNVANPEYWTTTEKTINYTQPASGTGTDGKPFQWTPDMINASGFGVFFDINFYSGGSGSVASLEKVEVTVYYTESTSTALRRPEPEAFENREIHVKTFSNPTSTSFKILAEGNSNEPITMRITDAAGRLLEMKNNIAPNTLLQFGASYKQGFYYAEIIQGTKRKTLKLIKN